MDQGAVLQPNVRLTQPMLGRRRDARLRVELRARLIAHDGTVSAVLADIARCGARLYAPDCGLRVRREAVLCWIEFEAFGEVVWNDGSYFALRFDEPVPDGVLRETRQAHDARLLPLERQLMREAAQAFVSPRHKL